MVLLKCIILYVMYVIYHFNFCELKVNKYWSNMEMNWEWTEVNSYMSGIW